jgi:nicotinamidase-related amidase
VRQEQHACFRTIENIEQIFRAAKARGFEVFIFARYFHPTDKGWRFNGPLEIEEVVSGMFARKGVLNLNGLAGSGADWLERLRPYIQDGKTIMVAPHRVWGPGTNDLVLQLCKRRIGKIILGGMLANMCVESQPRELIEHGFEVAPRERCDRRTEASQMELRLHCRADQLCVSRACGLDDRTKPSRRWSAIHKTRTNPWSLLRRWANG